MLGKDDAEFAIVVEAVTAGGPKVGSGGAAPSPATLEEAREQVEDLVRSGLKRSEAVRRVAAGTGLDRRELYRER